MSFRALAAVSLFAAVAAVNVAAAVAEEGASPPTARGRLTTVPLSSFQEAPLTLVTPGQGKASLRIVGQTIRYDVGYADTEGTVTQAHIHVGERATTGGVAAFLCSNLGNAPKGTPRCPGSGRVSGTVTAAQIVGAAAEQGVAAGEVSDLIRAIRAGAAYVNVHTDAFPAGEIRGDLRR